jgi:ketosteroid isomerase-like protein
MPRPPVVDQFFRCMQAGASNADEMMSLFTDDAEYVEPFSGKPSRHLGKPAIRKAMQMGWERPLPDMTISIDRLDLDGDDVRAEWTCRSPALPGGSGRGVNQYRLRDGRIARLETTLLGGTP